MRKTVKKHTETGRGEISLKGRIAELEEKLSESEKLVDIISKGKYQWQATFDVISDPVLIISRKYKIVRANLAFARFSGQDVRAIIGKKCFHIFAGRKSACPGCPVGRALEKKSSFSNDLEENVRNRDFVANAFPFIDEVDEDISVVVHYRDITEEIRLHHELVQQEKMVAIGMLAGGVAHEINNPLGGIIAFSQLIKRDIKDNEPLYADVEEIESAALRCKKIVQDLLDFSRTSSGKKKHWLEINPLIEKITPFLKMELRSQNIDLECSFAEDLPKIFGDANRLQQVFLNLLTNACHAMSRGGSLKVRTYDDPKNSNICIEVSDTGVGIAREHLPKVFDPFFTTKRPGKGTGLGLSISYRIVNDHGGMIQVRSKAGMGTTFIVSFPKVQEGDVKDAGGEE